VDTGALRGAAMSDVRLILGDCLELLPTLADKSVDAVITDPPYGLNIDYGDYQDTPENLERLIAGIVPQIKRVSSVAAVFCGVNNVQSYPKAEWVGCWFYGTTGNFGKFGYNAWQPILLYGANNNRYGMDTIKYSKMEKKADGHPCPKPLGLMELVVSRFTKQGDTVLDPFMGSGTTGVACVKLGRNFIGIEKEPKYYDIAARRIAEAQQQMVMAL
jgi:DNA modification methylase